ncbi:Protein MAEA-like protein [Bienertia sinuspersici]
MEIDPLPNGNSTTAVGSSSDAITGGEATAAMAEASASKATQLSDSLKLEHQFLRVPFEHYKKTIRCNHRSAEKEVSAVISSVDSASPDLNRDDAVSHLSSLVSRLQGLKRKEHIEETQWWLSCDNTCGKRWGWLWCLDQWQFGDERE